MPYGRSGVGPLCATLARCSGQHVLTGVFVLPVTDHRGTLSRTAGPEADELSASQVLGQGARGPSPGGTGSGGRAGTGDTAGQVALADWAETAHYM